jgi:hypothetical protein
VCNGLEIVVQCVVSTCVGCSKVRCLNEVLCAKCCINSDEKVKQGGSDFCSVCSGKTLCLGFSAKDILVRLKACSKFSRRSRPWLPGTYVTCKHTPPFADYEVASVR